MRIALQLSVDVGNDVHPDQVLTAAVQAIDAEEDCSVFASAIAHADERFRVVGTIKGNPSQRFDEVVRAEDAEQAEAKAIEIEPKLAPAAVLPLEGEPVDVLRAEAPKS